MPLKFHNTVFTSWRPFPLSVTLLWPALALLTPGCTNPGHRASALPVTYRNNAYGLTFRLPPNWNNYTVTTNHWQGITYIPAADTTVTTAHGPMIILRHPKWSATEPYQDIPIMVFTRSQWDADKQGKFSIGAGGFDEELWHNRKYVFALSSRYNAADDVKAWKEVEQIIQQNRVIHHEPLLYPE